MLSFPTIADLILFDPFFFFGSFALFVPIHHLGVSNLSIHTKLLIVFLLIHAFSAVHSFQCSGAVPIVAPSRSQSPQYGHNDNCK
jgi:hypothetical protein